MNTQKKNIIILAGNGTPAIAAVNIYCEQLEKDFSIFIVEEKRFTLKKIFSLLKKKFKKKGFFHLLDFLLLRIFLLFINRPSPVRRSYTPSLLVDDVNFPETLRFVEEHKPSFVLTVGCSILRKATIEKFQQTGATIINIHNGITPRYRGSGNIWALKEKNFDVTGSTVHLIDSGIDTGSRLATVRFMLSTCRFADMDTVALKAGALAAVYYIKHNRSFIHREFRYLLSRCYPYPGLSDYLIAWFNFVHYRKSSSLEATWKQHLSEAAISDSLSHLEKLECRDKKSVRERDRMIGEIFSDLLRNYSDRNVMILDVGCGDGRYRNLLHGYKEYVGCDFSRNTIKTGIRADFSKPSDKDKIRPYLNSLADSCFCASENNAFFIECDARIIPVRSESFDISMAIGLFQHLQNAQAVADEMLRVTGKGGYLIINTLRQFSLFELLLTGLTSIFKCSRLRPVLAITARDYTGRKKIDGVMVARKYSLSELLKIFHLERKNVTVYYNGLLGTRFMSREITLVAKI